MSTQLHSSAIVLQLREGDEVAVAMRDIAAGDLLAPFPVVAREPIPFGHKVSLAQVAAGAALHRLGQPIGLATEAIPAGAHVHTHNMGFEQSLAERQIGTRLSNAARLQAADTPTFEGFRRADGRVGTRNYIGILTSVNCSAHVAGMVADHFRNPAPLADFPNVDGVVALTHKTGCGMTQDEPLMALLRRTLGGYARHANFSAVVVLGLGCEVNQIGGSDAGAEAAQGPFLRTMEIQEVGGTRKRARPASPSSRDMLTDRQEGEARAGAGERTCRRRCNAAAPTAYSGISANPALGAASDLLVRHRRHRDPVGDAGDLWRRDIC